jgi:hypothetical protein
VMGGCGLGDERVRTELWDGNKVFLYFLPRKSWNLKSQKA